MLKKISLDILILVTAVSAGLFAVLALLVYPNAFNYVPTFIILLGNVPIALAAGFFALRGALPVALLVALFVGVVGVRQGGLVINPFWWQSSSLYLLFAVMVGSSAAIFRRRGSKAQARVPASPRPDTRLLASLVPALKLRDRASQGHSEWVAQNAFVVGRELGFTIRELETLYWAALLHDLGKTSVPAATLLKAGSLSEAEYAEVKRHPEHGAKLLTSLSPDFAPIAEIVRHHHERWDGGGYPQGLSGRFIPRPSRVIAVVDIFEALTSLRPYRDAMPAEQALQYLEQEAGRHFDPEVVKTFVACFRRGEIRYRQSQAKNMKTKTPALEELVKETVHRKN